MSLLKRITAGGVTEPPPGTFSQCLVAGDMIYVSGQHAGTDDGGVGGDGSMLSQATIALEKIKALVEAGALLARGRLKHQYPHSWRSKKSRRWSRPPAA